MLRKLGITLAWVALAALPLFVYSNTIAARFGLRDDYSVLREAQDSDTIVTAVNGGQGRPIYGWLLDKTFERMPDIAALSWSRAYSAICLGLLGVAAAWVLHRRIGWSRTTAWLVGALLTVLPSGQVLVGWGSCWPHVLAALLGAVGFALADPALRDRRWGRVALAGLVLLVATLTYQSNMLIAVMFVAAGVLSRRAVSTRATVEWAFGHLVLLGAVLAVAYVFTRVSFACGWFVPSSRVVFESDWLGKLAWMAREPLANAAALLALNDVEGRTATWYVLAAVTTGALTLAGIGLSGGWRRNLLELATLVTCVLVAYCVSLLAAERWSTYRTIYPLTGVVLVFAVSGLQRVAASRSAVVAGVLALLVVLGAVLARHQAYGLIAQPQMRELALLEQGARAIEPGKNQSVFVITPRPQDAAASLQYADEFGSLSTDSDWTPKEMLILLMRERFPGTPNVERGYRYTSNRMPPPAGRHEIVIDLRPLRSS
jgi:MFS family permease